MWRLGGQSVSSRWREIAKIRDGIGEIGGGWFVEGVSCQVGDEVNTFFWYDRWLGETPLCLRFSRLFDLSLNKSCSVAIMSHLGWGDGGGAWRWRRRLWAWEE